MLVVMQRTKEEEERPVCAVQPCRNGHYDVCDGDCVCLIE